MSVTAFQRRRRELAAKLAEEENKPKIKTLDEMTVAELKEIANSLGIKGFAKMKKPELIEAIKAHEELVKQKELEKALEEELVKQKELEKALEEELAKLREAAMEKGIKGFEEMTAEQLTEALKEKDINNQTGNGE